MIIGVLCIWGVKEGGGTPQWALQSRDCNLPNSCEFIEMISK